MTSRKLTRRSFLETTVVTASATTFVACGGGGDETPADPWAVFPQSVASGDPRPDSIVLWTRVETESAMEEVELELATDERFENRVTLSDGMLLAGADHDHCLRVKVVGLTAGTRYFYRFRALGTTSRTGRFKTAPLASTEANVRFAIVSCQDFVGRYYNSYTKLLEAEQDDLDAVIHLGDYIYETTGDPSFMMANEDRKVVFTDTTGALSRTEAGQTFYAAKSLSNYRELYRTYRGDRVLQQVHEKFPFIVTWDDHEFADDCWGANGTYTGGRQSEEDTSRRQASEQAFLEYQPLARDLTIEGEGELEAQSASSLFPTNKIYRDFRFGKHAHLVISDYRSYRPDHPIPENAWPGQVVMTEGEVRAGLAVWQTESRLPGGATTVDQAFTMGGFRHYVDLSESDYAPYVTALRAILTAQWSALEVEAATAADWAEAATSGNADVGVINALLAAPESQNLIPESVRGMVPAIDTEGLSRGLSFAGLGKGSMVGSVGSRYLVVQTSYDLYVEHLVRSEALGSPFGEAQQQFIRERISANADATWKVFGSSVSFTPLVVDLVPFAADLPIGFPAARYYLNVDHMDGFSAFKRQMLAEVLGPANAVIVSGDIHASFAADHGASSTGPRALELTCPGISSGNLRELLYGTAQQLPALRDQPAVATLLSALDGLLRLGSSSVKHSRSDVNGLAILTLTATEMTGDFWQLAKPEGGQDPVKIDLSSDASLSGMWKRNTVKSTRSGADNGPLLDVTA